jgi:hypothetical protein
VEKGGSSRRGRYVDEGRVEGREKMENDEKKKRIKGAEMKE